MYDVVKTYEKVSQEWIDKYSVIEESASINPTGMAGVKGCGSGADGAGKAR